MNSKVTLLRTMFYAPLCIALFRVLITVVILVWNPQDMPLRYIQLFPLMVVTVYSFLYFKLYNDGDPVITLMVPTILHFVLVWVLEKQIVWIPFLVPVLVDVLYLVVKGIKGSMFPFEFEGDDEVDALDKFDESELDGKAVPQ